MSSSPETEAGSSSSSSKKFKGVRKRKWGKWVSEIRLPNSRERIWLGSYDAPDKAARAFDAAFVCLRGRGAAGADLNFPDSPPPCRAGGCSSDPREVQAAALSHANRAAVTAQQAAAALIMDDADAADGGCSATPWDYYYSVATTWAAASLVAQLPARRRWWRPCAPTGASTGGPSWRTRRPSSPLPAGAAMRTTSCKCHRRRRRWPTRTWMTVSMAQPLLSGASTRETPTSDTSKAKLHRYRLQFYMHADAVQGYATRWRRMHASRQLASCTLHCYTAGALEKVVILWHSPHY
ncbi:unnamed protein product [Miscanthus lutarioriparius]|uniref:AP2/ERF domain-containing protein n=1 Tax=Miscanthus lutarioriparius TaxID=422564 RepID=A0A811PYA0_9POAL|nr:unnamed protein product [Miscanthus lutarioriparius]